MKKLLLSIALLASCANVVGQVHDIKTQPGIDMSKIDMSKGIPVQSQRISAANEDETRHRPDRLRERSTPPTFVPHLSPEQQMRQMMRKSNIAPPSLAHVGQKATGKK